MHSNVALIWHSVAVGAGSKLRAPKGGLVIFNYIKFIQLDTVTPTHASRQTTHINFLCLMGATTVHT